jgi:hypothetical protein
VNHARVRIVKTTGRGLTKSSAMLLPLIFGNHPAINRQSLSARPIERKSWALDFLCPTHLHSTKNAIIGKTASKINWKRLPGSFVIEFISFWRRA